MVNQKSLIGLGVATLVIVVAAFAIQHSRQPVSDFSDQAGRLAADLTDHVNDVSRLVVTSANKKTEVTLDKQDGIWVVAERGGYPADISKLREYLLKVANAKLIERKTAKADRYVDLGVADIDDPKAKGLAVEIAGLSAPVSFITGIFNAQSGGTFVRRSAESQSWLASGNLIPEKNPANWLRKALADIPSDRIASVTITPADGKVLRVFKEQPSDENYTIANVPKGREPSSEFAANGLASVLAELNIDDVASNKEVPVPDTVTEVRYVTFDGVLVDAKVWQIGDKHYVAMTASEDTERAQAFVDAELAKASTAADKSNDATEASDADGAPETQVADESAEPADAKPVAAPAENRDQRLAAISQQVDVLNAAFKGWSFILPGHKIGNMNKTLDDLLKPLETKSSTAK